MPPNPIPKNVVNPFSDAFLSTWDLWKEFRKEEHSFSYKGVISEQMALKRLVTVSEGEEEKAIRIVEQSISRGWMDFYDLKQPSPNGKSARSKKQSDADQPSLRDQAKAEFNRRNGGGGQSDNEPHLKAV